MGSRLAGVGIVLVGAAVVAAQSDFRIGGSMSRYEARYGTPEDHSLDENPASWPQGRSIRTVGELSRQPQTQGAHNPGIAGRPSDRIYSLHGRYEITLYPVPEIADRVEFDAPSWLGREVEVVGVFERSQDVGPALASGQSLGFNIWSMAVLPERKDKDFDAPRSSLEALVVDPEKAAGQMVKVTGTYRGANILDDLPGESRRSKDDWVLQDGPFSIWVTGSKPEGEGFSLGLRSRSDLRWQLDVQGTVEVHDGYVYLRAERLRLMGAAPDESE